MSTENQPARMGGDVPDWAIAQQPKSLDQATRHLQMLGAIDVNVFVGWASLNPGGVCVLVQSLIDRLPGPTRAVMLESLAAQHRARELSAHGGDGGGLTLCDRADGVRGHYAIGRRHADGYMEYWNLRSHKWASCSDDVMTKQEAEWVMGALLATQQPASGAGWSAEDACEQFIAAEVDSAPEALIRLGDWLNQVLDEDEAKTASRMVIGAMMECSDAVRKVSAMPSTPPTSASEARDTVEDAVMDVIATGTGVYRVTSASDVEVEAAIDAWWLEQVALNGGVPIGADYKHWAKQAWQAALTRSPARVGGVTDELVEALKAMLEYYDGYGPGNQAVESMARNAIAKATQQATP